MPFTSSIPSNHTTATLFAERLSVQMGCYNQRWEIKNIKGNSKRTIQNNLRAADDQSQNVIISLLETKMTQTQAL